MQVTVEPYDESGRERAIVSVARLYMYDCKL